MRDVMGKVIKDCTSLSTEQMPAQKRRGLLFGWWLIRTCPYYHYSRQLLQLPQLHPQMKWAGQP